jgi:hypothetical protein
MARRAPLLELLATHTGQLLPLLSARRFTHVKIPNAVAGHISLQLLDGITEGSGGLG